VSVTAPKGLRADLAEAVTGRAGPAGPAGEELAGLVNEYGPLAVGVSGQDEHLFTAVRRPATVDGVPAELLPHLAGAMVPKMEACLRAVCGGVPVAHVVDGRASQSTLLKVFTSSGMGTMVAP